MENKYEEKYLPSHSPNYWDDLIKRYFEAGTTDEEENKLKNFLISTEGADKKYDEIRAVFSFVLAGKQEHSLNASAKHDTCKTDTIECHTKITPFNGNKNLRKKILRISVAAIIIFSIIGSVGIHLVHQAQSQNCYAYIDGKKVTEPGIVKSKMMQSIENVDISDDDTSIQKQMEIIFAPL